MLEAEDRGRETMSEPFPDSAMLTSSTGDKAAWDARRRIERLRELRRLRELLDDPGLSELD
jgi:hypothetical protein